MATTACLVSGSQKIPCRGAVSLFLVQAKGCQRLRHAHLAFRRGKSRNSDAPALTTLQVHQKIQAAQHAVASQQLPWAAVSVWGWQDSPVAWADMEHSSAPNLGLGGSESSYAVLVLPGQDLLILRALSAGDA